MSGPRETTPASAPADSLRDIVSAFGSFVLIPFVFSIAGRVVDGADAGLFGLWMASGGLVLLKRTPLVGLPAVQVAAGALLMLLATTTLPGAEQFFEANPWRALWAVPGLAAFLLVAWALIRIDERHQPAARMACVKAMRSATFVQLLLHRWVPDLETQRP